MNPKPILELREATNNMEESTGIMRMRMMRMVEVTIKEVCNATNSEPAYPFYLDFLK